MLKESHLKKGVVVRNFTIITMMVLARFLGAAGKRSCVPLKKTCTEYTTRSFLRLSGMTKPAVSYQCAKRNTTTTPLEHWTDISLTELQAMMKAENIQLFDVREPHELVQTGKIACATNVPLRKVPEAFTMDPDEFEEEYSIKQPKKNDANIVFHCLGGVRSRAALEAVHQIGFTKARHYPGGYVEWAKVVEQSERSQA
ncbi:thiosulfate:glutathione sulfurtransferase-like [Montipora capricornis]|uniref:thiosulfate:glutathione sulfurtransferase-like n=1 Tax=Montipora foliosa TaxID=591990 RepID=UPI0035F174EE